MPVQQHRTARARRAHGPGGSGSSLSVCADHDEAGSFARGGGLPGVAGRNPLAMAWSPRTPKSRGRAGLRGHRSALPGADPRFAGTLASRRRARWSPRPGWDPKTGPSSWEACRKHRIVAYETESSEGSPEASPAEVAGMKATPRTHALAATSAIPWTRAGARGARGVSTRFAPPGALPLARRRRATTCSTTGGDSGSPRSLGHRQPGGRCCHVNRRGPCARLLPEGTLVIPTASRFRPTREAVPLRSGHRGGSARGTFSELAHPALTPTGGVDGLYFQSGA